jgi:hypothetical protein
MPFADDFAFVFNDFILAVSFYGRFYKIRCSQAKFKNLPAKKREKENRAYFNCCKIHKQDLQDN